MEAMDAWSVFLNTGNVLDYLRYSALKNSGEYFDNSQNADANGNKNKDGEIKQTLG